MFRRRVNRLLLVLAVLLNVSGGPMALAHSPGQAAPVAAAADAAEHCGGHGSQPADDPVPSGDSGVPCCAAGHCACSVASTVVPTSAPAFVQFVRFLRPDDLRLAEPPSVSLRDPLRPPIV
jgi:hypothetical protein